MQLSQNETINSTDIVFKLNDTESIKFEGLEFLDPIYPYDEIVIKFYENDKSYILGSDFIKYELLKLHSFLIAALDNKALLHSSINLDIGYLWNEELQDKQGLEYDRVEGMNFWVGLRNLMWETSKKTDPCLSTWLYNDSNRAIILEITPNYPWHSRDPKPNEHFISYDEWIQSYKPLLIRTIPREVAQAWKDIAENILKHIEKNTQEFDAAQPK